MKILVVAAHPDDEVIGCGGTIAKHTNNGDTVYISIIAEGVSAQYKDPNMLKVRRDAAKNAGNILGVKEIFFHDFPDSKLDTVSQIEINNVIEDHIKNLRPDIIYTHTKEDNHIDHQIINESTLIASRSHKHNYIKRIFSYELIGSTKLSFMPNYYVDITDTYDLKESAYKYYKSEIEKYPHPRSMKSIKTLANLRGILSGFKKAEAFFLERGVW